MCNADENTINIANLNSGIYLIKVGTTNGKEFATRIVKE
ncbi:MAG: T9SS type A sorting domain-containing protein [Bacteroidales bacterium]|nr:T9SS type A sorting domain-containing protein [Bacteroidales bacterium]